MSIIGAAAVDAAAGGTLNIGEDDLLTPLARERAKAAGVTVVVGAGAAPAPAAASLSAAPSPQATPTSTAPASRVPASAAPASAGGPGSRSVADAAEATMAALGPGPADTYPPSNALLRRGAPLPVSLGGRSLTPEPAPSRVVVVGAGHVGQIAALRLCDADLFNEVVLVDVVDGLAEGIALDLTHSAALGHFRTRVRGVTSVEEAGPASYVIITAGRARQPGMSRSDLIDTNAAIVGPIAEAVGRTSPQAVIVVVTNPLDEMTQHAWTASGLPAERVIGMAGVLDTARFQALCSLAGAGAADGVQALALGSHGEEMVVPLSQARAGGKPVSELIGRDDLTAIVDRTRGSGAEVVSLLKSGSAYLAPGMSAARMVIAMRRNTGEVLPAAVLARGEYGIDGVYVGLPVRLGPAGLNEIVELSLTEPELEDLRRAAGRIGERLGSLKAS